MGETRRKFDQDFRDSAVRIVRETGKPIAQVARDLGVNEGTMGNWVAIGRQRREAGDGALDAPRGRDECDPHGFTSPSAGTVLASWVRPCS